MWPFGLSLYFFVFFFTGYGKKNKKGGFGEKKYIFLNLLAVSSVRPFRFSLHKRGVFKKLRRLHEWLALKRTIHEAYQPRLIHDTS